VRVQSSTSVTIVNPAVILSIPAQAAPGSIINIQGTDLTGATSVLIGSIPMTSFAVVSNVLIQATLPLTASSGRVAIVKAGMMSVSPTVLKIAHEITSFSPTSGGYGTNVTITGRGFKPGATIKFNGVDAISTYISSTTLVALVPSTGSTGPITVTQDSSDVVSTSVFTVNLTSTPTPTLARRNALSVTSGGAGTALVLTGTNLLGTTSVTIGGSIVDFLALSSTQILVKISSVITTGLVSVVTPGGSTTSTTAFTHSGVLVAPTISSISPLQVTEGSEVTVLGTNIGAATNITLDGITLTRYRVMSANSISFVIEPGMVGGVISITTFGGVVTSVPIVVVI
jgi:hypothetical protein